ncbi:MAG: right-handed parallel beta-helix repeat-containing protein [Lewinellaceae bacterium]|nr:right-handed parallel beta-helix repeat-containing protein [Lewinellaceae bacterium]
MKNSTLLLVAILTFFLFSCKDKPGPITEIKIAAPSNDKLSQAIEDIAEDGVIILEAGEHFESEGIVLSKKVKIRGEDGAILRFPTEPTYNDTTPMDAGLYVLNVEGFCIENVEFIPIGPIGGVSIFLDGSHKSIIKDCKFTMDQYPIVMDRSNNVLVENNEIRCTEKFASGEFNWSVHGILIINGKAAEIRGNTISGCFFGAWVCDVGGTFENNTAYNNYIGVIPCAVPDSGAVTPRESYTWTMIPAKDWVIRNNELYQNSWYGILTFDNATENLIENNNCYQNGGNHPYGIDQGADIGLGGDSPMFFGFHAFPTHDNVVKTGDYPNVTIQDCGFGNMIEGGYVSLDTALIKCLK